MSALTEFLLARYAEEAAVARQGNPADDDDDDDDNNVDYEVPARWWAQPHGLICAWRMREFNEACRCTYPARVLADLASKRTIVELALNAAESLADDILCALALPYADHPDFRPEWRL